MYTVKTVVPRRSCRSIGRDHGEDLDPFADGMVQRYMRSAVKTPPKSVSPVSKTLLRDSGPACELLDSLDNILKGIVKEWLHLHPTVASAFSTPVVEILG